MNKNKKLIIIAIVFICIIFSRINVSANTLKVASPETLAITLVIDNSGSMATTDPQKLRETASNIFIDLLSPDDYLGIITFNKKEEVVLRMQQIQSSDNKTKFKKILSQKIQATGDTDYLLAIKEASKQLSTVNNGNVRKVILFLTDGEPDQNNTKKNDPAFVRELPSIYTDFKGEDTNYRLGEYLIVTSSLNMDGNKLLKSSELKIENYNLLLNYIKSGIETMSLLNNGSANNGDIKENYGIWSNKILFNKEDGGKASLIVNGTYKGETFLLEKAIGNFKVYPPGNLMIKPLNTNLYTSLNNQLTIPLEIVNTSNFTETMIISLDKDIGKLAPDRIKIEPLSKINKYVYVNLDKNLEKNIYDIKVKMVAEDIQTKVEPAEFNTEVQVISKTGYVLRYLKDNIIPIFMFLGIFVGLSLLIILMGLLLYRLFVHRNTIIQGKLSYWKESDSGAKDKKEFNFSKIGKDKIIITFNEENKTAEYHIFNSKYNYDIELTAIADKSRWKFIDGYKALFHRNNFSELLLKTNEPGIFIYDDKIFTSKKIYKNDKFITGGYIFQYFIDDKEKSTDKDRGKNVLREKEIPLIFKKL